MRNQSLFQNVLRQNLERISVVRSEWDRRALIEHLAAIKTAFSVEFVNANLMLRMAEDPVLLHAVSRSDLLVRDGIGVASAFRAYGLPAGQNMNGTDFIPELLSAMSPRRIALYGTTEPWLSRAAEWITELGHEVIDRADGFREIDDYVCRARLALPEVVVLGMGVPKQERLADVLKRKDGVDALILNGGAILDFLGGRFPRAPAVIRHLKLEWLFRFYCEPRRLWRRYTIELATYLQRVAADAAIWRLSTRPPLAVRSVRLAAGPASVIASRESGDA
jgi:N-acetylglucosaminyldiphosphoundecaprenol N-acetyl-beta-D-mannosaminyltransferase